MFSADHRRCCICGAILASHNSRVCFNAACRNSLELHYQQKLPTCRVCGRPTRTTGIQTLDLQSFCGNTGCQLKAASTLSVIQAGGKTCKSCGMLLPEMRAGFEYCDHEACLHIQARHRTQLLAQRREELRKQREAEAEILRDRALQEQKLREKAEAGKDLPLVALVPYTSQAVAENPLDRREQLLEHIRNLIQRAVVCLPSAADYLRPESDYLPEATEEEAQVFAVGCRLCRGHCCVAGNTHAFLTISTMRRVFQLYPAWSPQQVFDAYRTRIPEQSVQGSCVFHGQQGCTLPRRMRADLCNRFLCRDLQEIRKAIAENPPNQVFFLASHDEQGIADYDFATAAGDEISGSE